MRETPLGKTTAYSADYDATLLFAVPRSDARLALNLDKDLPFTGSDIWNAWEITWLDTGGKPVVATAVFIVDARSPNIIESKSLKLYLNSLAMTRYPSMKEVGALIADDLSRIAGSRVVVRIAAADNSPDCAISALPGNCIDHLDAGSIPAFIDADTLRCADDGVVSEDLYSHLLRSNCPFTNQPDMGSLLVRYRGPKIDPAALLRYIVSYRLHNDFHEACVERIFLDIKRRCSPQALTVYARYNRRGGLDINPFRTDAAEPAQNLRLWRQ